MTTRVSIARTIVGNTRIDDYARSLRLARDRGYRIGGVADFHRSDKQGRRLVLRHDVDVPRVGVRPMLEIESRLGIASTWYFRWRTLDDLLMREVIEAGGEVGLHYETLANVLERRQIHNRANVTEAVLQEARNELRQETDRFRARLGLTSLTIASHGHPRNQAVRISNNVLATEQFCRDAGVLVEAYSPEFLRHVDCYLSDTSLLINSGWAYNVSLAEAVDARHQRICFLSHPNHWYYTWRTKLVDLGKLALRGVRRQERSFHPTYDS
jgi:hypothetical protein